jgi:hypothetical protein
VPRSKVKQKAKKPKATKTNEKTQLTKVRNPEATKVTKAYKSQTEKHFLIALL